MDEITKGILSAIFGSEFARWATRFRYPIVFLIGAVGSEIYMFVSIAAEKGARIALSLMLGKALTTVGLIFPVVMGVIAVFITFMASIGIENEKRKK
ncbi:hypothetical protein [Burkholderia sp. S-53]|uniref:hypothetical protein n=1 Tax=Burkholderia sp. S-53 TaxID=2906514 RepID=UPI0021D210C5|nr:hypothetical protein [Burkholderia sp. S-53]UXU89093.1 hypothetical protein LXM88_11720 [Burkholderia sp. S-53]